MPELTAEFADVEMDDGHDANDADTVIYYCCRAGNWFHQQG